MTLTGMLTDESAPTVFAKVCKTGALETLAACSLAHGFVGLEIFDVPCLLLACFEKKADRDHLS